MAESIFKGKAFQFDRDQDIGILNFDLEGEKVNKLSEVSLGELELIIKQLQVNAQGLKAILICSKKKNSFIVGADINLIKRLKNQEEAQFASSYGQKIFNMLEDLKIPTIAAIDGPCMGGGTELVSACKFRICSDNEKTMIAVPEVKLGILPGWGGTYRLPKIVGLMTATDMILTGKNIRADKAQKLGLVDLVVPSAIFTEKALEIAHQVAKNGKVPGAKARIVSPQEKLLTGTLLGRLVFFRKAKAEVVKSSRGHYPSPLKSLIILDKFRLANREDSLAAEAKSFGELWATDVSHNLVNLFLMAEAAKRDSGTTLPDSTLSQLPKISSVGVLGAGVMGGGIAAQAATYGISSLVKDLNFQALSKALAHARSLFDADLKKRKIKVFQRDQRMALIRSQIDYTGFKSLDLIVEAVVENVEVKKSVFKDLEKEIRPDAIVASNTSSLRLDQMAVAFKDPSRFVGLHFFNPVHKMPLVEVITHEGTSPEVVARVVAFSKAIGKTPVVVKDGPGFLVNRLLMPWLNEAAYCLAEGYDMAAMDRALKRFGMPMGPFELLDEVGLDVCCKVGHILAEGFGERAKPASVLDQILEYNKNLPKGETPLLGRKSGSGFYTWDRPGGRRQELAVEKIQKIVFGGKAPKAPEFSEEAIVRRMIYPMINEAALALSEGIVNTPAQVDLGMIFGTGFPPFRGGLCRFADSVGLKKIEVELKRLADTHGVRVAPSEALKKLARSPGSFYASPQ